MRAGYEGWSVEPEVLSLGIRADCVCVNVCVVCQLAMASDLCTGVLSVFAGANLYFHFE